VQTNSSMIENLDNIKKYNPWANNHIESGFKRTYYTNKVIKYIGNNLIKVLIGQRRTGKSYILRQIANELLLQGVKPQNILYINKEYLEYGNILTAEDLQDLYNTYKKELHPTDKVYLFIDEIQYIKDWERFVNSHSQDFAEPCEVFISGSNSNLLSGELATLLSGRYVQFEILPYSFEEYCALLSKEENKQTYIEYIKGSALPELFNLPTEEMKRNYISTIKDTVILRDIVNRYKVKDIKLLDDLFVYLSNNVSNLVSITNIINYFNSRKRKTNYETLSSYIHYLENSFLVHAAERYDIKGKDVLSGVCKYYINDLGFHNYLYNGFGMGNGYLLENAVYIELRRHEFNVYVGNTAQKEVDFVAIKGNEKIYIQVCYQMDNKQTIEREYASLKSIKDNYKKIVISMDDICLTSNEGIENTNPWTLKSIL
jgi:predicted AAA+ superfamily ATPase